jgi:hypothetical protein
VAEVPSKAGWEEKAVSKGSGRVVRRIREGMWTGGWWDGRCEKWHGEWGTHAWLGGAVRSACLGRKGNCLVLTTLVRMRKPALGTVRYYLQQGKCICDMGETNCGAAVALTQDASFWFNSGPRDLLVLLACSSWPGPAACPTARSSLL